ncbi:hypothetical protein QWJ34_01190 [Saccharibacillus sp. CPCC 101409]|uniref:hypothetical protein n=1 Tax=Saccharibacillus sp. CPCC 101409 TaxID=3058041 RepID=UPI0026716DD0|nr:hypothetical protein [Saccharibacillus sp. CPCC 101409]MDO3408375.1 hypothetical protein [Saccharibacillus sp. CPCC 101409]
MRKMKKNTLNPFSPSVRFGIRPPAGQNFIRQPSGVVILPPTEEERLKIEDEMRRYIQNKKEHSIK